MTQITKAGAARRRRTGPTLWMAVPSLALFAVFALLPLFGVIVLSFTSWDGLGTPAWTGIDNWSRVLADPTTHNALWLSLIVVVTAWLVQTPISLLLGVFMAGHQRYRNVLSILYFLPLLFSSAAIAIAFRSLLDPNFGVGAATGLRWLSQDWLGNPQLALGVVVFVIGWSFIPFHSLLYQAGVRQIPATLYEAARLDGANAWQAFWQITVPQLRNTIVTSSTLILVGSLTYFDLVYVLTQGGPGTSTRILPLHMYLMGFRSFDMGGASVSAVILVLVGLSISLILNGIARSHRMDSQQEGL
ncbi:carbohydrate ABC transporter permease [Microbacterium sp. 18062]|uniref:carbohydrate ABC transporter permease n=1 Tax=Microbacterium sp. 18062 TaxID=2681410 RepID=UPI00190F6C71|nr:sugar ABC transporter permease [Microbacterium sp. 18062]